MNIPSPNTGAPVHLTERRPEMSPEEMAANLVPPPQFERASFDSYRPDEQYPSQQEAVEYLKGFSAGAPHERPRLFSRRRKKPPMKQGVYLDGGFGVGKTHLLAALWNAESGNAKYFGTFIEYTALVGALGYANTVTLFTGASLICIDEFELDDPGDTMMMTRLLTSLASTGTRLAATSNTPPNALGEGRFAAQDFMREIHSLSTHFATLRIDGTDFRRRSVEGHARSLSEQELSERIDQRNQSGTTMSDDSFRELIEHLATVHPSRYIRLLDGIDELGIRNVERLDSQAEALRLVAFIDRVYDAQIPVSTSGIELDKVFSDEMLAGGYRKKYLRSMSRMISLTE